MTFLLLIGMTCIGAALQALPTKTLKLPDGSNPIMLPKALRGHPVISANECVYPQSHMTLHVYRYSWKGNLIAFLASMTEAWKVKPELTKDNQVILERRLKHGPVSRQALVIAQQQAVKDPSNVYGVRFVRRPGWIRVSYNEELPQKK